MIRARKRFIVRLPIELDAFLRRRAAALGVRPGTLISALTEEELMRARTQPDYQFIDAFELLLPTRRWTARSAGNQVTVYLTDEAADALLWVERLTGYESHRTAVAGVLLNTTEGRRFAEEQGIHT